MGVGVAGNAAIEAITGSVVSRAQVGGTLHRETILNKGDAKAGAGSVFGGMGRVEEVGEKETDELEGHGDHGVPDKGEYGADGEALDEDLIAKGTRGEDGGFPIGRGRICGSLFVCLEYC